MTTRKHDSEALRLEIERLRNAEASCTCVDVIRSAVKDTLMADAADDIRKALRDVKRLRERNNDDDAFRMLELDRVEFSLQQALNALTPTATIGRD